MSPFSLHARRPGGDVRRPAIARDPDTTRAFLEDAAHYPGGHTAGVAVPRSEAEMSAIVTTCQTVLAVGAQSSLTGGATPQGETVVSTAGLNHVLDIGRDTVRVQAGVTLADLDAALRREGRYYPPAPTFTGAFVGGTVATNAAGAATFKHGATRDWVQALAVVLASGEVLDIERGATRADEGVFDIVLSDRTVRLVAPDYRMPRVPKVSAGYFSQPGMDLIDLFIGSEGTLGIVTEATLRILPQRPAFCLAWIPVADRADALRLVARLRVEAREAWRSGGARGIDVAAIEHLDARSLALLEEDRVEGVSWSGAAMALIVTLELPSSTDAAQAFDEIGRAADRDAPDTMLVRFCRLLAEADVLDAVEIAAPGDHTRASQLAAVREAVPDAVNQRVGRAKLAIDPRIEKTAADMIVPFDALGSLLDIYDEGFARRGLDGAVWGHISDGNLHPNVIPRSFADVEAGRAAILEFGREVIRLGGSPLAEHGVGRNPVKQQLLIELYGREGVDQMRRIKRALDPEWKLAPGVLFSRGE